MVATGLLGEDPQHAATACRFALAILREASQVRAIEWVRGEPEEQGLRV